MWACPGVLPAQMHRRQYWSLVANLTQWKTGSPCFLFSIPNAYHLVILFPTKHGKGDHNSSKCRDLYLKYALIRVIKANSNDIIYNTMMILSPLADNQESALYIYMETVHEDLNYYLISKWQESGSFLIYYKYIWSLPFLLPPSQLYLDKPPRDAIHYKIPLKSCGMWTGTNPRHICHIIKILCLKYLCHYRLAGTGSSPQLWVNILTVFMDSMWCSLAGQQRQTIECEPIIFHVFLK